MYTGDGGFLAFASFDFLRGLRDEDGRLLGEGKALAGEVPAATIRLTNEPALLQILAHWPQILLRIRRIRAAIVSTGAPSALELWRIAPAAACVVSFHCLERGTASPIPVADAALFKASVGMKYALRHAEVARLEHGDAIGSPPTAAAIWDYIDRERLLTGAVEVCAGPELLIRELLDVLVAGGADPPAHAASPDGTDINKLLAYADLLAVWETTVLVARAEEGAAGDGRLVAIGRTMLRDVCKAVGFAIIPDVTLGRSLIERALQRLFERAAP
jgi:hypothetical protein